MDFKSSNNDEDHPNTKLEMFQYVKVVDQANFPKDDEDETQLLAVVAS